MQIHPFLDVYWLFRWMDPYLQWDKIWCKAWHYLIGLSQTMYSLSLSLIVLRLEINWYLVCNKCCKYLALNRYTQSRVHDTSYLIPVPHCASYSSTPLNGRFLLKDVPGCCISRSGRRNLRSMIRMCRLHRPGLYGEYFWIRVLYVKFHSNI